MIFVRKHFKVGDIVEPYLAKKYGNLGEGIVTEVTKAKEKYIRVVFPTTDGVFRTYQFSRERLRIVQAPIAVESKLKRIAREYNELMLELIQI